MVLFQFNKLVRGQGKSICIGSSDWRAVNSLESNSDRAVLESLKEGRGEGGRVFKS